MHRFYEHPDYAQLEKDISEIERYKKVLQTYCDNNIALQRVHQSTIIKILTQVDPDIYGYAKIDQVCDVYAVLQPFVKALSQHEPDYLNRHEVLIQSVLSSVTPSNIHHDDNFSPDSFRLIQFKSSAAELFYHDVLERRAEEIMAISVLVSGFRR